MIVAKKQVLFKQGGVWDEFFRGELVTDPGWGLLCVMMGSGQGTPVPRSPAPSLLCLGLGKGSCPDAHGGAGTDIQTEPKTQEPAGLALPMRCNPVPGRFLCSCPSLAPSALPPWPPVGATHIVLPSLGLTRSSFLAKGPRAQVEDHREFDFQRPSLPEVSSGPMTQYPGAPGALPGLIPMHQIVMRVSGTMEVACLISAWHRGSACHGISTPSPVPPLDWHPGLGTSLLDAGCVCFL